MDQGWDRQDALSGQLFQRESKISHDVHECVVPCQALVHVSSIDDSIAVGRKVALEDCTISGMLIPKGTTVGANMIDAHFHPSMWGDNADEFDPYRFIKLEKETGKTLQLATSTLYIVAFGYGRHACPGRFFAAQEMKLMMAYFLYYYDMRLEGQDGERPKNSWMGGGNLPDAKARIIIRRRQCAE